MGDMKNITHSNIQEIIQIIEEAYVPSNATIIVVGNIAYNKTLSMIEDKFGDWKDIKCRIKEVPVENVPGIYLNAGNGKSAVIIDTDGSILFCSNTPDTEKRLGYLDNNGTIKLERLADYYSLQTLSARDNLECRNCIELPLCISSCKYARFKENSKCKGKRGEGLSVKEKAMLDLYKQNNK